MEISSIVTSSLLKVVSTAIFEVFRIDAAIGSTVLRCTCGSNEDHLHVRVRASEAASWVHRLGMSTRVGLAGAQDQLAGAVREAWGASRGGMHSAFPRAVVSMME